MGAPSLVPQGLGTATLAGAVALEPVQLSWVPRWTSPQGALAVVVSAVGLGAEGLRAR